MTRPVPTYANAETDTPSDCGCLLIIDEQTGARLDGVIEVNVTEGWLRRIKRDPDGVLRADPATGKAREERVEGRFRLEWAA